MYFLKTLFLKDLSNLCKFAATITDQALSICIHGMHWAFANPYLMTSWQDLCALVSAVPFDDLFQTRTWLYTLTVWACTSCLLNCFLATAKKNVKLSPISNISVSDTFYVLYVSVKQYFCVCIKK